MNSKHVALLFIALMMLGLGGASVASITSSDAKIVSPTPTPGLVDFNLFPSQQTQQQAPPQGQSIQQQTQVQQDINQAPQGQAVGVEEKVNQRFPQPQGKQYAAYPGDLPLEQLIRKKAVIKTNKGNIEFDIYPEATKAASNFIFLSNEKFYDGLIFHRVVPGFVIQGGDPSGTGSGGPGYQFPDEPVTRKYEKGIVAMANSGPNTNGSQFFIMLEDKLDMDSKYTIFGKVFSGMDIVQQIQIGDMMRKITIQNSL